LNIFHREFVARFSEAKRLVPFIPNQRYVSCTFG
jgi:hypothetical protein